MTGVVRAMLTAAALAVGCGLAPGRAAAETATFLAISDIHLDPFAGSDGDRRLLAADAAAWPAILAAASAPVVSYGSDTNLPLLDAVLADAVRRVPSPDFVVYPGDTLAHRFAERVRAADPDATDATVTGAAVNATAFVAGRLRAAFPDVPVLPALGNNDAGCGDYRLEAGGDYLAGTLPTLRALVGAGRLAADAEATWRAGGYYAARHPTVADAAVLVLSTVLWSPEYQNGCGASAGERDAPGDAMLAWLEARLAAATARGERVWLVYHIPAGVDAFSTARRGSAGSCAARTVAFWREPYASAFARLMAQHGGTVAAAFSGHIHSDSWSLFARADGAPGTFASIVPAVSPIYGDAPAYQAFAYDRAAGALSDKTTYAVTNLPDAAQGAPVATARLYGFAEAYGADAYDAAAVGRITGALRADPPSPARSLYARFYGAGHGDEPDTDWPVYACAPGTATAAAFDACRCGAQ